MGISTHVLDLSLGRPATGVPVYLEQQASSGDWHPLASGETDAEGRCKNLVPSGVSPGVYRIRFDTHRYFQKLHIEGLYPEVLVIFFVRDASAHHHIPLLLSPNGYTTYRGS